MQGRNRSPVEGIRSGSVGIGRLSPERSFQGHGMYGSGSRSFRRGGGGGGGYRRGPSKPHFSYPPPPPPPPRRKIDVFMEAGRLAAEYLVARGVLPASSLPPSSRWISNGSGQEFKGRDRENSSFDGRVSVMNRLGSSNPDGSSGRRRYNEEFENVGLRNTSRGRRKRMDHYNGPRGSDWRRENERNGPWIDRSRSFNDSDNFGDEDDFAPGYRRAGFEDFGGGRSSRSLADSEPPSRSDFAGESESDNYDCPEDTASKVSFSTDRKEPLPESDANLNKELGDGRPSAMEIIEGKSDKSSSEVGKEEMEENSVNSAVPHQLVMEDHITIQGNDLLRSFESVKVPTKPRSSMANRSLKVVGSPAVGTENTDQQTATEKGRTSDAVAEPMVSMEEGSTRVPSSDQTTILAQSLMCPAGEKSVILPFQHIEESTDPNPDFPTEGKACTSSAQNQAESCDIVPAPAFTSESLSYGKSHSFPERSSIAGSQAELCPNPTFKTPSVNLHTKVDDGYPLHCVTGGGIKRPRDWTSSIILHDDDYMHVHNLRAKQSSPSGQTLFQDNEMVDSVDQTKLINAELFPKIEPETSIRLEEERQLMPNSFKICDLNLMETPDVTEIPDDPIIQHTSGTALTMEAGNEASVEFGLAVGHNSSNNNIYGQCSNDNKVIQVIDLEDDSSAEDGACDLSKPKNEVMYSNLENFLNHSENTVDLPDIHDGYGLPMSDLLGPDMSSCPQVTGEMNSLQQGMGLLEGGLPGDDDSIYVSLGEIPIGFMDAWDPPPQEYGKYF